MLFFFYRATTFLRETSIYTPIHKNVVVGTIIKRDIYEATNIAIPLSLRSEIIIFVMWF